MVKSRLQARRKAKTIIVKSKALASGQYSETNLLTGLSASREPGNAEEVITGGGAIVNVSDTFWFEAEAGESLPAIEEKHVLVDEDDIRYEVVSVTDQGGEGDRLKVMTRRLR
jgi:hypothetical protein